MNKNGKKKTCNTRNISNTSPSVVEFDQLTRVDHSSFPSQLRDAPAGRFHRHFAKSKHQTEVCQYSYGAMSYDENLMKKIIPNDFG